MTNFSTGGRLTLAIILSICFNFLGSGVALAENQTIEADGIYIMGDGPDENQSVAKGRARLEAKRAAAEKAGVLVQSISEAKNHQITKDEINTISSQVLRIQSEKFTPEVMGETIRYICHIVAIVDSDNVSKKLSQNGDDLNKAIAEKKRKDQELAAIKAELAELKAKYKVANEAGRREINREVKKNEMKFTAAEWVERGKAYVQYYDLNDDTVYNDKKAIECYRKALEINPKYAPAWVAMGNAYYYKVNRIGGICDDKIIKTAMSYYKEAIKADPKYAPAWNYLGHIYNFEMNFKKAKDCFLKATELDPMDFYSWSSLGYIYYSKIIDDQKALEAYSKAVEASEKTAVKNSVKVAEIWTELGHVAYKLGDYQKAVEAYKKAMEMVELPSYRQNYERAWAKLVMK